MDMNKPAEQDRAASPLRDARKTIVKYLVWIVVILLLTNPGLIPFLPQGVKSSMTGAVSRLLGDVTQISGVLRFNWVVLIQLIIMVLVLRLLHVVLQALIIRVKPRRSRTRTVLHLLYSAQNYIFVLVGIFWGLSILGVDVSTMLAGVGIVALVLGFGAESLIADVVTGIFMIFENEYNVGDIIEVDGFRGTVDSIGIRTTCLRDGGDNIKVLNNSDIRNLVNLSERSSTAVCDLPVPYTADLRRVRTLMEDKLLPELKEQDPDVFRQVPRLLGVQEFGDNAVILRVAAPVAEKDRFAAERELREALKVGLDSNGFGWNRGSVPFGK